MKKNQKKIPNRFKLTPEVFKSLELLAKTLPKFQRRDNNGNLLSRKVVLFDGTKDFTKGGGKIPTTYTKLLKSKLEPLLVNHEINLREIYQKDGQSGVESYVKFFTDLASKEAVNEPVKTEN